MIDSGIFTLQFLELPGLRDLKHAKLTFPAVESLFTDLMPSTNFLDCFFATLGFTRGADLLLG